MAPPKREMLEDHLVQSSEHVAAGERQLSRQRRIVAELERCGHDSANAKERLALFEDLQRLHEADRDRLLREVDNWRPPTRRGLVK